MSTPTAERRSSPPTTPLTWARAHVNDVLTWLIVLGSFAIGYAAYLLRQPFFYPDSRYYLAMAYWFGGESQESARDLTVAFGEHYNMPIPNIDTLFGWGLVQPRVILPALAALPVKLFGPFGLAGTVLVIFLCLTIALTLILRRRFGNGVAVTVMLLLNSSHFIMMFNGGMLTESLSALWTVATLVVAWWWLEKRRWWMLVLLSATVVGAAFTRQATFIVAGAFVIAWLLGSALRRRWNDWTIPAVVVAATSLACQLLQSVIFPSFSQLNQFLKQTGTDSLGGALLEVPRMAADILTSDVRTFLYQDVPLLIFIILALVGAVIFFRRTESHLLIGAILGTALYNITNGTPTQFRYAIPGLIFFVLAAALTLRAATTRADAAPADATPADPAHAPDATTTTDTATTDTAMGDQSSQAVIR
ncbi:hypothetical protein [Microbacterium aurugineum]